MNNKNTKLNQIKEPYKVRKSGPITDRLDFSKTHTSLPVDDLTNVQKESFQWLIKEGLEETFRNIYPIKSTNERIQIEYIENSLRIEVPEDEFDAVKTAQQKGSTYNFKLFAKLRKTDEDTGEVKDDEVLFGEIPYMTKGGAFVINGSKKVIVSQLIRSPGAYYKIVDRRDSGEHLYNRLEIIPKLGIWIEIFHKVTVRDTIKVYIDKSKTISLSWFLRAFGLSKDTILDFFGRNSILEDTLKKDKVASETDALEEVHGVIKKGDRITAESKKYLFANYLFNKRRYDLTKTGRYTINNKLNIVDRVANTFAAEDLAVTYVDKNDVTHKGIKKGDFIDVVAAEAIQRAFKEGQLQMVEIPELNKEIYGKNASDVLNSRTKVIMVRVWQNKRAMEDGQDPVIVIGNDPNSTEEHILIPDIVASVSYYLNIIDGLGNEDDIDSMVYKRIVTIGELLQNQFQIALTKLERNAKERMSAKEPEQITAKNITNNKLIFNQFKTFFNSSQLCQFMDQVNPLAEVANKRRVTSLGPGGLNRDTASTDVRDVHPTHYGRICPIESPEGLNIGLILNFAVHSKVNEYGFIETPYFPVKNGKVIYKPQYMSVNQEKGKTFAQSTIAVDKDGKIQDEQIVARIDSEYVIINSSEVDYIEVSSRQLASVSASCIPFLESDDANRALMGANMQRQAVPLLNAEAPYIATGTEADVAKYSSSNILSENDGVVTYVDSRQVKVKSEAGSTKTYSLKSFERSNQGTIISQKPIVTEGQKINAGDLLTDASSFHNGELALGKNVLVAFTTWKGFNYEDAVIISERLVKEDVYTSIHIEEQTVQFRIAKAGDDELTKEIPNVSTHAKRNLDEKGIIKVGSEVLAGDILVGKVSPKGEENPTSDDKLVAAIFSQRTKPVKDTSLKVKHGHGGTVIDVQVLSREAGDKLQDGVWLIVKVFIAQKRKIQVGDKMAGRHGNKGVISRVLPIEDMPHLEDGTPIDIMLNPQGVPSRMNIGQVLELHLGMAARHLGVQFLSPVFDGIKYSTINQLLDAAGLPENGKFNIIDPVTGEKIDHKISVGVMYMLKLAHMVDDKMHARSIGPYSLITQQPLGGKSQNGGQRFGEMEVWSIESYGATNVLQELLTYKSDNIDGRNKIYHSLTTDAPLPKPGTPESFVVLAHELRGLGMKLGVEHDERFNEEGEE